MLRYDASTGDCFVFTLKEGLLSPIAHDLCIRVTSWRLEIEAGPNGSVRAEADAGSLRVESAVREGAPLAGALTDADRRKIEANLREDVLHSQRYPTITFTGRQVEPRGTGFVLTGELMLHGARSQVRVPVERRGDRLRAELRIQQPDFGIKPYRAMLGTLRIQSEVRVEVTVPAAGIGPEGA